jgi:hypothetical protein
MARGSPSGVAASLYYFLPRVEGPGAAADTVRRSVGTAREDTTGLAPTPRVGRLPPSGLPPAPAPTPEPGLAPPRLGATDPGLPLPLPPAPLRRVGGDAVVLPFPR